MQRNVIAVKDGLAALDIPVIPNVSESCSGGLLNADYHSTAFTHCPSSCR